jgi:hypothetical protein
MWEFWVFRGYVFPFLPLTHAARRKAVNPRTSFLNPRPSWISTMNPNWYIAKPVPCGLPVFHPTISPMISSSGLFTFLMHFTHALNKHEPIAISAIVNLCNLLICSLSLPNCCCGLKRRVLRPVVEEAGFHDCEQLSSGERVVGEVSSPRGSPISATNLW